MRLLKEKLTVEVAHVNGVKIHLHNIYGKLKVPSRLALAYYARTRGLA